MSKSSLHQIVPFPLPVYLASFFSSQLTTKPVLMEDGSYAKPFSISRHSNFGTFLLRNLSKSTKPPIIKEGFTFFIKVTESLTKHDTTIIDSRYSFVNFSEEKIAEITTIFKQVFESHLIEHVNAFTDGVKFIVPKKERGIKNRAIFNFCKKYGVQFTDQNLSAWKQMIYRENKRPKHNKIRML